MGGKFSQVDCTLAETTFKLTTWQRYKNVLSDAFEFITAFSREGPEKVYVQHRLREHARAVSRLVSQGAHIYICGDANSMARQVNAALVQILVEQNNLSRSDAEKFLSDMKSRQQYQVSRLIKY